MGGGFCHLLGRTGYSWSRGLWACALMFGSPSAQEEAGAAGAEGGLRGGWDRVREGRGGVSQRPRGSFPRGRPPWQAPAWRFLGRFVIVESCHRLPRLRRHRSTVQTVS